jgi:hypothetical protein
VVNIDGLVVVVLEELVPPPPPPHPFRSRNNIKNTVEILMRILIEIDQPPSF